MTTTGSPLVSICVPTRNRTAFLARSLPTILGQDYPNLEILLSDNCSTDGTEGLCLAAAAADARVRYIRHDPDIGLYGNHNYCLDTARGEFVALWHDDDERDVGLVSALVALMTANPTVGIVSTACWLIDDEGAPLGSRVDDAPPVTPGLDYIARTFASGQSIVRCPGALIRRSALGDARFEEDGPLGFADFVLWFRIAESADIGYLPTRLWSYRLHRQSFSRRKMWQVADDYEHHLGGYCRAVTVRRPDLAERASQWRSTLDRFLFWALGYEVAGRSEPGTARRDTRYQTMFDIARYSLDPGERREAGRRMRRYIRGPVQFVVASVVLTMVKLGLTGPLRWISARPDLIRRALGLR